MTSESGTDHALHLQSKGLTTSEKPNGEAKRGQATTALCARKAINMEAINTGVAPRSHWLNVASSLSR